MPGKYRFRWLPMPYSRPHFLLVAFASPCPNQACLTEWSIAWAHCWPGALDQACALCPWHSAMGRPLWGLESFRRRGLCDSLTAPRPIYASPPSHFRFLPAPPFIPLLITIGDCPLVSIEVHIWHIELSVGTVGNSPLIIPQYHILISHCQILYKSPHFLSKYPPF
jgi:hypothetical protein